MSQQKITIALIGDPDGLPLLEDMVLNFAERHRDSNYPFDSNIKAESAYILKNFPFANYQVDILKVTEFNKNLPTFDGAILCTLSPPFIEETEPALDAREDPYYCLAEKLGCTSNALQRFFYSPEELFNFKNSERNLDVIEEIKNVSSSMIETSLLTLIRSKRIKDYWFLAWIYPSNTGSGLLPLVLFTISVGVLIGLAVSSLLLTPFLSIPITFFVAGCITGAVWFANRKKTTLEIPKELDSNLQSEILPPVNDGQNNPDPYPYSEILSKPSKPAKNLPLAQEAADKLRVIFNRVFYEEIQKSDLIEKPAFKITFNFSESGEIFLKCTNTQLNLEEAILQFQQYEKKLKNLLGNDVQMNRIPITQVNNLPELDHIVEKQKNDKKFW